MQRRSFNRAAVLVGAGAATAVAMGAWMAQAQAGGEPFKEGKHYTKLDKPVPGAGGEGQIEIFEFFAYTCIHCYHLEPLMAEWMKKHKGVVVHRTPVAFRSGMEDMQRLYYTIEAMGLVQSMHERMFRAVHVDKVRIQDATEAAQWMAGQGVDMKKFREVYGSFAVNAKAKRATQLQGLYGVEGTPALGVAGRFYVPGQGPRTLAVADHLIAGLRTS